MQAINANPILILIALIIIFMILGLYASARVIAAAITRSRKNKKNEDEEESSANEGLQYSDESGSGRLKIKYALSIIALIVPVIIIFSALLYGVMIAAEMFSVQGRSGREFLIFAMLITAAVAITAGIVGALILSSKMARPIRKLLFHVEELNNANNLSNIANMKIHVAGCDELSAIGKEINKMNKGLARAAEISSQLLQGKEIQKKFLPLEIGTGGNRLSSGFLDTEKAVFFGYYIGANEISGDYFDYKELGNDYYVIIKCDAAGKGIPAALIMIQVATMFINHFNNWTPTDEGMWIENLVYQINGFIETLGFKDRFAAFTLCLFNSRTGELHFCNAGDNVLNIFNAEEKKVISITLNETPAAGLLSNDMVVSKGGYRVQTVNINRGDILLLYTDGLEDSRHLFRNNANMEIKCRDGEAGMVHENHFVGQKGELLGRERIHAIANAVMNREVYRLKKWHTPETEQDLTFDFSGCSGSVEEIIVAIIACEKMFRCYRDPEAANSKVSVGLKVDAFLQSHFAQYSDYCVQPHYCPGDDSHIYYNQLDEDVQEDDITILGIKRK